MIGDDRTYANKLFHDRLRVDFRNCGVKYIDKEIEHSLCHTEIHTNDCRACQVCTPNATNVVWSHCQCVLADGVERGILTANRMLPGPSIQVCENDKVVIDVENHMEGMEVTIHWHGIWQRGSQYYDGVPFVTQCPIQQGNTFRYTENFRIYQTIA